MFHAKTLEIKKKTLLKLSLVKPRYNAEAASKSCELYILGDMYYYFIF